MTSFGPPPGFTPPASSGDGDGDNNNNNNSGGTSLAADHPWTWVLIPVAVLISLGAVAACLHTSRRRRRAAQLRHESSLNNRRLTPSSPHLSPRARHRRHRGQDLEAGAAYYHADGTAASRWWALPPSQNNHHRPSHRLPEEGLNELGEAPPPYEKKLENLVPNPNRNVNNSHNNNDATREGGGGDHHHHHHHHDDDDDAVDDYDEGSRGTETETETETLEMQELPGQNEIAELDAGESSTARAVALSRERDSTIPKEMDACHGGVVTGGDSDDDTSGDDHSEDPDHATVVEYRQAYAVTITSGTASRTESPASWTKGDDSSPNGRLRTDRRTRTRTRSRRRRRRSSVDSGGGDGGNVGEGSVPPGRKTNNNNGDEDDHVHNVENDADLREPPRAVLPSEEEGRGRKGL